MKRLQRHVLPLLALGFWFVFLLAQSAPWFWFGDLVISFAWRLGQAGLGLTLLLLWRKRWALAGLTALATGALLWPEGQLYLPREQSPVTRTPLRLACANLLFENTRFDAFEPWLREVDPDVLVANEVDAEWEPILRELAGYPHRIFGQPAPSTGRRIGGVAILSKHPFLEHREIAPDHPSVRGTLDVTLDWAGQALRLRGAHAVRPGAAWRHPVRRAWFDRIATELEWQPPSVLLGDLNLASSSPLYRRFVRQTGLLDSRQGFGRQPTFSNLHTFLGSALAIDHVLLTPDWTVLDRFTSWLPGSDHRAVVVDLALR